MYLAGNNCHVLLFTLILLAYSRIIVRRPSLTTFIECYVSLNVSTEVKIKAHTHRRRDATVASAV